MASSIGVHEIILGKWVTKAKGSDPGRDKELSETERAELERLRKENTILRMERVHPLYLFDPARTYRYVKVAAVHFGSFSISQPTGFFDRYSTPIWSVLFGTCHHWRQFFGSATEKSRR